MYCEYTGVDAEDESSGSPEEIRAGEGRGRGCGGVGPSSSPLLSVAGELSSVSPISSTGFQMSWFLSRLVNDRPSLDLLHPSRSVVSSSASSPTVSDARFRFFGGFECAGSEYFGAGVDD